jgi:hypothetical protein
MEELKESVRKVSMAYAHESLRRDCVKPSI